MTKKYDEFNEPLQKRMVNFVVAALLALLKIVIPADPNGLLVDVMAKMKDKPTVSEHEKLRANMVALTKKLPERAAQRQALESVLSTSYSAIYLKNDLKIGKVKMT